MEINFTQILGSMQSAVADFLDRPWGTTEFWVILVVCLFAVLFFGKLLASWVAGSRRGVIAIGLGFLLPIAIGLFVRAVLDIYVEKVFTNETLVLYIPIVIGFATYGLATLTLTPMFLNANFMGSMLSYAVTMAIMWAILNYSDGIVNLYNTGLGNVKKASSYALEGAPQILDGTPLEDWKFEGEEDANDLRDSFRKNEFGFQKEGPQPKVKPDKKYGWGVEN